MMSTSENNFHNELEHGWLALPDPGLGLIHLSGPDAWDWLQGQATNDLRKIPERGLLPFCLCEPTGQLLAICQLKSYSKDEFIIVTDNASGFMHRVQNMVVMEEVEAEDFTNQYRLIRVRGEDASGFAQDNDAADSWFLSHTDFGYPAYDIWYGLEWYERALANKPTPISQEAFDCLRIENGVPLRGIDYTTKTLPPELGPAFEAKHISYNKGCYTGQEVLMRMHSRGHTNKTWVGLRLSDSANVGDRITFEDKEVGSVTSAALSPKLGPIAAATLRNEATSDGTEVRVGSVTGIVKQMPLV